MGPNPSIEGTSNIGFRRLSAELDIDTRDGLPAFAEAGGKTGVPLLIINGQGVAGFSTAAYDALLRTRNERR